MFGLYWHVRDDLLCSHVHHSILQLASVGTDDAHMHAVWSDTAGSWSGPPTLTATGQTKDTSSTIYKPQQYDSLALLHDM